MIVRSTAKALVVSEGRLLLIRLRDRLNGEHYTLPGGGQNPLETLGEALVRECLEETGYAVRPIRLAALFETIVEDEEFGRIHPEHVHALHHAFLCELDRGARLEPTEPDTGQTGVEWVSLEALAGIRLFPGILKERLGEALAGGALAYLGCERIRSRANPERMEASTDGLPR